MEWILIKNKKNLEQKLLEEPFTLENITESKVKISKSLWEFYEIHYTGKANAQCSAWKSHMIEESLANAKSCLLWWETNICH